MTCVVERMKTSITSGARSERHFSTRAQRKLNWAQQIQFEYFKTQLTLKMWSLAGLTPVLINLHRRK